MRFLGIYLYILLLSELKNSKRPLTSKDKPTASDEEDEGEAEAESEDEIDSEEENTAEKQQRSSEDGTPKESWVSSCYLNFTLFPPV